MKGLQFDIIQFYLNKKVSNKVQSHKKRKFGISRKTNKLFPKNSINYFFEPLFDKIGYFFKIF